jgi:hypothetical protein
VDSTSSLLVLIRQAYSYRPRVVLSADAAAPGFPGGEFSTPGTLYPFTGRIIGAISHIIRSIHRQDVESETRSGPESHESMEK